VRRNAFKIEEERYRSLGKRLQGHVRDTVWARGLA
jgi:hypothetical protein